MKKRLFDIDSDEVLRILSLHEERTKNQYLNIISEQATPAASYTTMQWNEFNGGDFGLPKDTKFVATSDPLIVRAPNATAYVKYNGNWSKQKRSVSFYCKLGKFFIQGYEKQPLVSTAISQKLIKNVCGKVNFKPTTAAKGKTYKQSKVQEFETQGGKTGQIAANTVWTWNGKEAVGTTPGRPKPTMFSCTPYNTVYGFNFKYNNEFYKNTSGELLNMLKKSFCLVQDKSQPKGESSASGDDSVQQAINKVTSDKLWYNYPCIPTNPNAKPGQMDNGSTVFIIGQEYFFNNGRKRKADGTMTNYTCKDTSTTSRPSSSRGSSQFTQDVVNLNTEIQTSLGVQTPTGQLTDADIDAILAKLG